MDHAGCGGCNSVHYCNDVCQKEDWPYHREKCSYLQGKIREMREASMEMEAKNVDLNLPRIGIFDSFKGLLASIATRSLKARSLSASGKRAEYLSQLSKLEKSYQNFVNYFRKKFGSLNESALMQILKGIFDQVASAEISQPPNQKVQGLLDYFNMFDPNLFFSGEGTRFASALYRGDKRDAKVQAGLIGNKLDTARK
jgi:hypothetical protein